MKILKKRESPDILPVATGRTTLLRTMLLQLQVGEGLDLPLEDWKSKKTPYYIVARIKKSYGMQFEYGFKTDGTGWLFRRIA